MLFLKAWNKKINADIIHNSNIFVCMPYPFRKLPIMGFHNFFPFVVISKLHLFFFYLSPECCSTFASVLGMLFNAFPMTFLTSMNFVSAKFFNPLFIKIWCYIDERISRAPNEERENLTHTGHIERKRNTEKITK